MFRSGPRGKVRLSPSASQVAPVLRLADDHARRDELPGPRRGSYIFASGKKTELLVEVARAQK